MKTLFVSFFLPFLLFSCTDDLDIPKPDPIDVIDHQEHPRHLEYSHLLLDYRLKTNAPGAVMLISREGEPLWAGASGKCNLEHQSSMEINTQFRIASISKIFIAVAVMQMIEAGQLRLDEKLSTLLPSVSGKIPHSDIITIQHLLGHLSGIFDPTNDSPRYKLDLINDPDRIAGMSIEQLLKEYVFPKPLHFMPGTNYRYSNANYWLLGQILESISHKSLHQILKENIFDPLDLKQTYLEKRDDRNVARGYADIYGDGKLLDVTLWERAEVDGNAAGGIISNVTDLFQFMQALMQGQLVSVESLELMKQIQWSGCTNADCESGLGLELWRTGAGTGYGKNGTTVGTEANIVYFPNSGNMFAIMKNNGVGSDKSFLDDLMK